MLVRKIISGTPIGAFTSGGGLAAAFDGNASQAASNCAQKNNTTQGSIGLTLSKPTRIRKVTFCGSSDEGFVDGAGAVQCQFDIMGRVGSYVAPPTDPDDETNWTNIASGSTVYSDTDDATQRTIDINASHRLTYFDHVVLNWKADFVANRTLNIGELEFYELLTDGGIVSALL